MINALDDELLSMAEAAKLLGVAGGTVYKNCRYGVCGLKLESIQIGRRRYTTRAAINEFCLARAQAEQDQPPDERDPAMTKRLRKAALL